MDGNSWKYDISRDADDKKMDGEITFLPFGRKLLVLLTSSL